MDIILLLIIVILVILFAILVLAIYIRRGMGLPEGNGDTRRGNRQHI